MKSSKGGRPPAGKNKRTHRVAFYLSDNEFKNLQSLKIGLLNHSPTLSLNDFFRLVIEKYDDTLIDYLNAEEQSEVKKYMRTLRSSSIIFDD